ncbi:nicotinate-nucleotide--dimethylbenzimidazole phosphoribosyltransferase [Peptostreptococcus stomatis]|uniref:nicotinate-nucleotide--dimethylbenzimidazole phosphoribosyltransferase n=1 Tax=Peptostreptococcus stomatis TaxID=341694 RepID=UPI003FA129A3
MNLLVSISSNIYPLDKKSIDKARARWDDLIHPPKTMGKLEDMTCMMAGIYGTDEIEDRPKKCIIAFAGDHGVHDEGVSAYPQDITRLQFENFVNGKCGVANLAECNGVHMFGVDIGMKGRESIVGILNYKIREGTDNMTLGPAMSLDDAVKSIEIGIEVAERCIVDDYKIIGIGEMGIGNTTPATAILSVMSGKDPMEIVVSESANPGQELKHKADVIRKAIEVNNPNPTDGIEVLAKVGGLEIGGMVGVILGCAANKIPVVIDGFISYAAVLIANRINPRCLDYLIPSHLSGHPGSKLAMEILKMEPILDMKMCLGEGTGAALAMPIIDSAIYAYNNMARFSQEHLGQFLRSYESDQKK